MVAVGFAWFLAGLAEANGDTLFTLGSYVAPLYVAIVVHMVLAFPTGRLETLRPARDRDRRRLHGRPRRPPALLPARGGTGRRPQGPPDQERLRRSSTCPTSPTCSATRRGHRHRRAGRRPLLLVRKRRSAAPAPAPRAGPDAVDEARRSASTARHRRVLEVGGAARPGSAGRGAGWRPSPSPSLPFAFLAGLVRSRYSRAGAVGGLIERLKATEAESLRGRADGRARRPSLKLVYWRPSAGHYVDYDGRPVELPAGSAARSPRWSGRAPRRRDRPRRVAGRGARAGARGGASAALALENERLEAELRARLEELQTSRARLVEVSMSSAGAWSGICTTAPSSASSRSRCSSGWPSAVRGSPTAAGASSTPLATSSRGARGAPRARARHPSGRPDRPRARAARWRRWPGASPLPVSLDQMPASDSRRRRGGRLLRRRGGADQRRQVRGRSTRQRARRAGTAPARSSRSATTASAAPTPTAARACAAWPTGSRRSTAPRGPLAARGGTLVRAKVPCA